MHFRIYGTLQGDARAACCSLPVFSSLCDREKGPLFSESLRSPKRNSELVEIASDKVDALTVPKSKIKLRKTKQ